jgi:leader peptidase (prepilin peptidase)/N-methyltransferase
MFASVLTAHYLFALLVILGLFIGSFLNVVIIRLPKMLEQSWLQQSYALLEKKPPEHLNTAHGNLFWPPSHCPHCQKTLAFWHNIPLLSFILLQGRCYFCKAPISWQYPLVELATAFISVITVAHIGLNYAALMALLLSWGLIALAMIDLRTFLLPDQLTLPLLWLGLLANIHTLFVPLEAAVIGAVSGYLVLWSIYWLHKGLTGKEGLGYGDFKLLAVLGAWLGWQSLLFIVFIASILGIIYYLGTMLIAPTTRQRMLPFGPFLALAGWFLLLYHDTLWAWYLYWIIY